MPQQPPGAEDYGDVLLSELVDAWKAKGPDYRPRTHHFEDDAHATPTYVNRLIRETSPYLLQHAHNPINWYPWGDEAFEAARRLGRPVFLSIGYSTCHWCHVMERESFENVQIAEFVNERYIPIKVDREERPDVDGIYMKSVQLMTGQGGWPMSVWLDHERRPYYAGTYFPPGDGMRGAPIGFANLMARLHHVFVEDPKRVAESAGSLVNALQTHAGSRSSGDMVGAEVLMKAAEYYKDHFDSSYGGISGAPKFPSSMPVRVLLRMHRRTGDDELLKIATFTLEKMADGGMYDHAGGGFHRYSVDHYWLVPHFEKMLYDNALLATAYLEGYQATGNARFAKVAREILRYVQRDMTAPGGAFYSATDADSLTPEGHSEEGYFFTWTPDEIDQVLNADEAKVVKAYFDVTDRGNFEGRNILNTPEPAAKVASALGMSADELLAIADRAKEKLYEVRKSRPAPIRDEKIQTSWNGLMISAFARAGLALADDSYTRSAVRAAEFLLAEVEKDGRLLHTFNEGEARFNGYLDDYAFLTHALIDLFEATGEARWIGKAIELTETVERHFRDDEVGGYFMTSDDHEKLLTREKPDYDGAEPTGNSLHALNLLRLHALTSDDKYRRRALALFQGFHEQLTRMPMALSEALVALDFYLDKAKEIVLVSPEGDATGDALLDEVRRAFVPNRVLARATAGEVEALAMTVPIVEGKAAIDGKATAYVCHEGVCLEPATEPAALV
ncbi:MAG: thioredoxin domain-containing protein, partial [Deltaproteobacteria bacterium]|nr:thioredoxin domain-containing protein [Deltaproteobacteria bacterium]